MKISGFTFIRNAVILSYPLKESILSVLPLCDQFVIAVGDSNDETLDLVKSIDNPKIKIIETVWDTRLKSGGIIYSQQTNLALSHCTGEWCIYIQADEVIHEDDHDIIRSDIKLADQRNIDSVLFRYNHFYGSYDFIGKGRQWYRREIRAFKNSGSIVSWGDAQGFRKSIDAGITKLTALQSEARIFHYGWVRPTKAQQKKLKLVHTYYHQDAEYKLDESDEPEFDYNSAYELTPFKGSHPSVMNKRIENDKVWTNRFDGSKTKRKPLLMKLTDAIENKTGYRIGEYKDFVEVKR